MTFPEFGAYWNSDGEDGKKKGTVRLQADYDLDAARTSGGGSDRCPHGWHEPLGAGDKLRAVHAAGGEGGKAVTLEMLKEMADFHFYVWIAMHTFLFLIVCALFSATFRHLDRIERKLDAITRTEEE